METNHGFQINEISFDEYRIHGHLNSIDTIYKDEIDSLIFHLILTFLKLRITGITDRQLEKSGKSIFFSLEINKAREIYSKIGENEAIDSNLLKSDVFNILYRYDVISHLHASSCLTDLYCNVDLISIKHKRRTMEDDFCVIHDLLGLIKKENILPYNISLYAVFDGHSGNHASKYLRLNVGRYIANKIISVIDREDNLTKKTWTEILGKGIREFNTMYCARYGNKRAGATLNLWIRAHKLLVNTNLGDSRGYIIGENGQALNTPFLHSFQDNNEYAHSLIKGAKFTIKEGIVRVDGLLSISRTFGDAYFQRYLNPEPDVTFFELNGQQKLLVVATDGLWDGTKIEELGPTLVKSLNNHEDLKPCLRNYVKQSQIVTHDNITVILVSLP